MTRMGTNNTLLCIHRDPAQLSLLQENGYELVTATNVKLGRDHERKPRTQTPARLRRPGRSREGRNIDTPKPLKLAMDEVNELDAPFSARVWRTIRNGTVPF